MSPAIKNEAIKAQQPVIRDTVRDINIFCLSRGKNLPKSWTIFEEIADNNESAVDVMAAIIPQIANTNKVLLVIAAITGINGSAPAGIDIFLILANIPKKRGINENPTSIKLARKADIVAVNLVLAAKKRCAKSCSIKENNVGIISVGKKSVYVNFLEKK